MNTANMLKEVKREIESLQKVVELLGGSSVRKGKGKKRKLSAKARKAIGDAQRKRWAEKRKKEA